MVNIPSLYCVILHYEAAIGDTIASFISTLDSKTRTTTKTRFSERALVSAVVNIFMTGS